MARVGLVFVSHSALIAAGLVELAAQMAPSTTLVAAGGTEDGGIGTSFERVSDAILRADGGAGVVVIGDLGSAILTAETAVDLLPDPPPAGVRVLDVPIVEGGVAAAVAAEAGEDIGGVARAAAGGGAAAQPEHDAGAAREQVVRLADPAGLHARPAAELARTAGRFESRITVDGADARSLLAVLAKGLRQGSEVLVRAEGPDAADAIDAVVAVLEHAT